MHGASANTSRVMGQIMVHTVAVKERVVHFTPGPDDPGHLHFNYGLCNRVIHSRFVESCVVYAWLNNHYFERH